MPLVFVPTSETLFFWGGESLGMLPPLFSALATPERATLETPEGRSEVSGMGFPLSAAASALAMLPTADLEGLPSSVGSWALASKLAIELIARERVVPTITRRKGRVEARWAAALSSSEETSKVDAIARSMSPAAHAVPTPLSAPGEVWAPEALLRAYLDAVIDGWVRASRGGPSLPEKQAKSGRDWSRRWQDALQGPEPSFETGGFAERTLVDDLERWSEPAVGARDRLRACFRLELPEEDGDSFQLRFLLQAPDDPSLQVTAEEIWSAQGGLEKLGRAFRDPAESLLEALGRAARLFSPIDRALSESKPESLALDPTAAWSFLGEGAALLSDAGFGVIVPAELTRSGERRLRLRMRVGGSKATTAGVVAGASGLAMDELLQVEWQAVIGDDSLTARELAALAKQKAPLVRFRGAWVAVDPRELEEIRLRMSREEKISMREAVQVALAGETEAGTLPVTVLATGGLAELIEQVKASSSRYATAPSALHASLRPYQERGLSWLLTMSSLGLGACLADDMGLGKTMQLLAYLLRSWELSPDEDRPALLVAPTSVIGNWEREVERFAPSLSVTHHYGTKRLKEPARFSKKPGSLVITSYDLLRRDADLLSQVDWSVVLLDEAQNIKNAASTTAVAARRIRARARFALTGTPVENRLAELWSILEFCNPALLGGLSDFRRNYAVPIERFGNDAAAERLRKVVGPFILRRLKSDPKVIQDLPPKNEMKVVCTLTREQATLYKAVVDEEMRRIDEAEGIERRGRVLALLTFTKQICNHPAQYLSERGPLEKRSGKLARVTEMLEEALSAGDKALVFTQFREMGEKLVAHLTHTLGVEVLFLHGGTAKKARDQMVARFQEEPRGPRIFVLSVKAGGTGLNLTAANHVFHFDRWWNPAVEDQATDRAYRIGQKRTVQVHKLVCAGTVEGKIDRLLEQKRELAGKVVGKGEQWITELDGGELRSLFALSRSAVVVEADA